MTMNIPTVLSMTTTMMSLLPVVFSVDSSGSSDDFDNANRFLNDYKEAQQQQSTTASKLQIKLNHLINNHKAPLKLYDDIVNLFNEYMSSNNFK
jgi:hypothetical protein